MRSADCYNWHMPSENGPKPALFVDIGQRFGRLTVISTDARLYMTPSTPKGRRAAVCRCDCGAETTVTISGLRSGKNKTCGVKCVYSPGKVSAQTPEGRARAAALTSSLTPEQEARKRAGSTKHGFSPRGKRHPLYNIWHLMMYRCENPVAPSYPRYGGRGIKICERWHDLATFIADIEAEIGPRPEGHTVGKMRKVPHYTLDRIDNDGHYEPGNVKWSTHAEQQANRRVLHTECSEGGCERPPRANGMCDMHYKRWRKRKQATAAA